MNRYNCLLAVACVSICGTASCFTLSPTTTTARTTASLTRSTSSNNVQHEGNSIANQSRPGTAQWRSRLHSTMAIEEEASADTTAVVVGSIAFLVSNSDTPSKFGSFSPVDNPSNWDAAHHLAKKATFFSEDQVETMIYRTPTSKDEALERQLKDADILIALGLQSKEELEFAKRIFQERANGGNRNKQCHFALDCAESLPAKVGPFMQSNPSIIADLFPWTDTAAGKRFYKQMQGLFDRWTSDDFTVALMLFLNRFSGYPVDWVRYSVDATWEKGPIRNAQEFVGMVSSCGDCIKNCAQDKKCLECINKLTELDTRDQTASYRTIVSYESDLLRDFSFCILQKNNVFGCKAEIPKLPSVTPIATWKNKPVTTEVGRSLLVGHLKDEDLAPEGSKGLDVSWKVACGANVAYDQFPSQNQIFYDSVNGKDMWYDPVFRVETLDGRDIWCKRHYKVRNGKEPGTFYFSVLDNGVTSNEFWNIIDAADDLSWIVFHYAGAAAVVGQRYIGGLLCTADGSLPPESEFPRIWSSFQRAGIEPWELFVVNNDSTGALEAGPPPLDYYRKDVIQAKAAKIATAV